MTDGNGEQEGTRAPRRPWADHWLLEAFQRLGHQAAAQLAGIHADSAWEALQQAGAKEAQLLETACALSARQAADLTDVGPSQAQLLDRALADRYGVVPVRLRDGMLEVATANPLMPDLEQTLEFASGLRISLTVASPAATRGAIYRVYQVSQTAATSSRQLSWVRATPQGIPDVVGGGSAVETLDAIIEDALARRASDIHIEPSEAGLLVRFRLDGVLADVRHIPRETTGPLMSRLKVMAGLDIADRMRPQDGRASVVFEGGSVDLRISTLPLGSAGEKAVIRLLNSSATNADLGNIGFTTGERQRFERLLRLTEGMVLVTGPTGSGKTTTLYSALRLIKTQASNLVTVEDPIEYRLEGVNQVQVHEKSGLTFAAALRSILRQDPDVVLVGEIRDAETANIAIKASMTGHVVLSTLHTNDAVSAVSRLLDIGADRGAMAGALKGILAQRLVRRLCTNCSQTDSLEDLQIEFQYLLAELDCDGLRKAVGCPACRHSGYKGRTIVPEVLVVTPDIQRAIARGADGPELTSLVRRAGTRSLWEAGLERVIAGITSLHELLDNVAAPLVENHGGQSAVDALLDELKTGPAREPELPWAAEVLSRNIAPPRATSPSIPGVRGDQWRVLVVDEDRTRRRELRDDLQAAGFGVLEAADGEAALAYARQLRPDVVITEIATPKLDASGLIQALTQHADSPPVIVFTDQRDQELHGWLRDLGAMDVVGRSHDVASLIRHLEDSARSVSTPQISLTAS
jgi:type II secretory ATPase GspE/PulE/Tfp pilus assembly ATPase PilB-like protein/CheY-like chemotaxis protein